MSRSRTLLTACISLMLLLCLGLLLPFDSWSDILIRPWRLLLGSGQQLNATLLEASGGNAGRLLKPLGQVKLVRQVELDPEAKP